MKKNILVLGMMLVASGTVFAQGQITLANNSSTLIRLDSSVGSLVTNTINPASGVTFSLFAATTTLGVTNTSVAPLATPLTSIVNAAVPGRIANATTLVNALGTGQLYTFRIFAWQTSFGSYANALSSGGYTGFSAFFNAAASGINPGTGAPDPATSVAGLYPAFFLTAVPEPSTMVLAGLGAASLLLFRRRKQA